MSFDEQPDPLSDCMEAFDKLKARLAEVEAEKTLLVSKIEELSRNSQCWVPDSLFRETKIRLARASEIINQQRKAIVEAAVPLEVLKAVEAQSPLLSADLRTSIHRAITKIREAIMLRMDEDVQP